MKTSSGFCGYDLTGRTALVSVILLGAALAAVAQSTTPQVSLTVDNAQASADAPLTLTLQDALDRARKNDPQFQAAVTAAKLAHEDRIQARAALLPSVGVTTQALLTQGNGMTPNGRFVTNDGVHVYRGWGVLHQELGVNTFTLASYHGMEAAEALARAQQEIARRGLKVTVTQAYYALVGGQRKYGTAQQSRDQAGHFLKISQEMEKQGQVAHSDVVRFQIQFNQQEQAFEEARLAMDNARLSLAVLLFPDFNQNFTVVDDLDNAQVLPGLAEVQSLAKQNNPQLAAALASLGQSNANVSVARAAFFPTLSVEVDYGIEANAFALRSVNLGFPEAGRLPNLGYFATLALNLPVWDWGSLRSKLHQAQDRRDQARLELTFAQRQLLSNLYADYNEAKTARSEAEMLRSSADLSAESLRLNTLRYRAGEATVLELVDAENTFTQAQNAFADGLARYRVALATLQTVTGNF
jgi:outer membrane protein